MARRISRLMMRRMIMIASVMMRLILKMKMMIGMKIKLVKVP